MACENAPDYLIQARDIKKTYKLGNASIQALKGISIDIKDGEFLTIGGPSGSGKSTLLHLLGCLDAPTEGKITISGKKIQDMNDNYLSDFRAKNIGFVFQSFNLLPVLTASENVEYQMLLNGVSKKERKARVKSIFEEVGLKDCKTRFPNELSGGQRQRIAVARALVNEPMILIADEPTANLDSKTGQKIIDLIISLSKKKNTSLIISTHDTNLIQKGDRSVMIMDGYIENPHNGGKA